MADIYLDAANIGRYVADRLSIAQLKNSSLSVKIGERRDFCFADEQRRLGTPAVCVLRSDHSAERYELNSLKSMRWPMMALARMLGDLGPG